MASTRRDLSGPMKITMFMLGALAALTGIFATAGTASAAETHTITVDNGRLTMGYVFLNNQILPADIPGPLDPNLPNTSSSGTIKVQVDGSTATVAANDFDMPIVWIPDPTAGGAPIPMRFGPDPQGLSGSWNAATGELSLKGTLRVDVIWGYDENDDPKICRFTAPDVTWSTGRNGISPGVPFSSPQGLEGNGAISAFWPALPSGESINGGDCGKPNAVVRDPGAVWLSSGIEQVPPAPTCQEEGKDGLWPDCVEEEWPDPDPDPDTDPEPAPRVRIAKVQVGKASVRAGKKTRMVIRVTNRGNKAARGLKVNLRSNRKTVKVPRQIKLNVPAGKTATARVVIRTTRKARGKAVITVKAAGRTGKGRVTVKPVRKKRR